MAVQDRSAFHAVSTNPHQRQLLLFSLISQLCAPRPSVPDSDFCRLIVDSRLDWGVEPIDANTSWLYLPRAARARQLAGCLVLTAD
jgi:hypothetical protein